MLKRKIGIGCGLFALMYTTQMATGLNLNESKLQIVRAEETCSSIEECNEQINATEDRILAARAEEEAARGLFITVDNDLTSIVESIDEIEAGIDALKDEITEIENLIAEHEVELAKIDVEIENLQDIIAHRMRFSQRMNNSNELLGFLSESESLIMFIRRVRTINLLTATDAELMEELNELVARQQSILESLQEEKNTLAAKRSELEAEMNVLEDYKADLEAEKERLAQDIERYENIALSEEEALKIAEAQKEILNQTVIPEVQVSENSNNTSNISNGISTSNGMFIFPMASGTVTCEWECYAGHRGIDLSHSNRNNPIIAAATGVVLTAAWHNSYGYYVIINHNINGQTYGTLYAHLAQQPSVSPGQTVTQGQQIGIMGNTGNSTGPHLHFEVHPGGWRWGGSVNPRQYFNFPQQGRWW